MSTLPNNYSAAAIELRLKLRRDFDLVYSPLYQQAPEKILSIYRQIPTPSPSEIEYALVRVAPTDIPQLVATMGTLESQHRSLVLVRCPATLITTLTPHLGPLTASDRSMIMARCVSEQITTIAPSMSPLTPTEHVIAWALWPSDQLHTLADVAGPFTEEQYIDLLYRADVDHIGTLFETIRTPTLDQQELFVLRTGALPPRCTLAPAWLRTNMDLITPPNYMQFVVYCGEVITAEEFATLLCTSDPAMVVPLAEYYATHIRALSFDHINMVICRASWGIARIINLLPDHSSPMIYECVLACRPLEIIDINIRAPISDNVKVILILRCHPRDIPRLAARYRSTAPSLRQFALMRCDPRRLPELITQLTPLAETEWITALYLSVPEKMRALWELIENPPAHATLVASTRCAPEAFVAPFNDDPELFIIRAAPVHIARYRNPLTPQLQKWAQMRQRTYPGTFQGCDPSQVPRICNMLHRKSTDDRFYALLACDESTIVTVAKQLAPLTIEEYRIVTLRCDPEVFSTLITLPIPEGLEEHTIMYWRCAPHHVWRLFSSQLFAPEAPSDYLACLTRAYSGQPLFGLSDDSCKFMVLKCHPNHVVTYFRQLRAPSDTEWQIAVLRTPVHRITELVMTVAPPPQAIPAILACATPMCLNVLAPVLLPQLSGPELARYMLRVSMQYRIAQLHVDMSLPWSAGARTALIYRTWDVQAAAAIFNNLTPSEALRLVVHSRGAHILRSLSLFPNPHLLLERIICRCSPSFVTTLLNAASYFIPGTQTTQFIPTLRHIAFQRCCPSLRAILFPVVAEMTAGEYFDAFIATPPDLIPVMAGPQINTTLRTIRCAPVQMTALNFPPDSTTLFMCDPRNVLEILSRFPNPSENIRRMAQYRCPDEDVRRQFRILGEMSIEEQHQFLRALEAIRNPRPEPPTTRPSTSRPTTSTPRPDAQPRMARRCEILEDQLELAANLSKLVARDIHALEFAQAVTPVTPETQRIIDVTLRAIARHLGTLRKLEAEARTLFIQAQAAERTAEVWRCLNMSTQIMEIAHAAIGIGSRTLARNETH